MGEDWITGSVAVTEAEWMLDGAQVITGTATVKYWRQSGANKEYLQSDNTTWLTTSFSHSLTLLSGVWRRTFTVPISANNFVVFEEVQHSDTELPIYKDEHNIISDVNAGGKFG